MEKTILFLRIALGWLFFYAGFTKLTNPSWTAAGFLKGAKTFTGLYHWFALPANIGWVNFLNEWGLTLIGVALILGIFVRFASSSGIAIMLLYYFPHLQFPKVGSNSFLIDEHIIYSLALLLLFKANAGKTFGLDNFVKSLPFIKNSPLKSL